MFFSVLVLVRTLYAQNNDNYRRYLEEKKLSIIQRKDSISNDQEKHGYLNTISIEPVSLTTSMLFLFSGDLPTIFSMSYGHKLNYSTELTVTARLQYIPVRNPRTNQTFLKDIIIGYQNQPFF